MFHYNPFIPLLMSDAHNQRIMGYKGLPVSPPPPPFSLSPSPSLTWCSHCRRSPAWWWCRPPSPPHSATCWWPPTPWPPSASLSQSLRTRQSPWPALSSTTTSSRGLLTFLWRYFIFITLKCVTIDNLCRTNILKGTVLIWFFSIVLSVALTLSGDSVLSVHCTFISIQVQYCNIFSFEDY